MIETEYSETLFGEIPENPLYIKQHGLATFCNAHVLSHIREYVEIEVHMYKTAYQKVEIQTFTNAQGPFSCLHN